MKPGQVFMNIKAERRQFERYLFPGNSKLKAKLNLFDDDNTTIVADVTNLSEEGLGFNYSEPLPMSLCEGDWIILKGTEGLPELKFLAGFEMKLKWVMSYNQSRGTIFGCLFVNLPPAAKEQIKEFVRERINKELIDT
jgi:hypothetical protein